MVVIGCILKGLETKYALGRITHNISKHDFYTVVRRTRHCTELQASTITHWMLDEGYIYDNIDDFGWTHHTWYDTIRRFRTNKSSDTPLIRHCTSNETVVSALAWLGM